MSRERNTRRPCALTIAGSDSGGGAGIQADLRTFAAHRVHGLCVVTALTAQNTRAVTAVHEVPTRMLSAQWQALLDDFSIGAIKTGMLGTRRQVLAVVRLLDGRPAAMPVVVDPVMVASSGAVLLDPDALAVLRGRLLPLADLLTPNLPEAELLLGRRIATGDDLTRAAHELQALGPRAVLLKGGHLAASTVTDVLCTGSAVVRFRHRRLAVEGHGTGCTLSAAIAARLARGETLVDAVRGAGDYVHRALRGAFRPGRGPVAVLDHFTAAG
jgi:hydroxymethylpyrimidine/phosphomethylpyrimidine kinase